MSGIFPTPPVGDQQPAVDDHTQFGAARERIGKLACKDLAQPEYQGGRKLDAERNKGYLSLCDIHEAINQRSDSIFGLFAVGALIVNFACR